MSLAVAPPLARQPAPRGSARRGLRDRWVVATGFLLVASAWLLGRAGWFSSGDDLSYWIAVAGGSMMLALLLYPLRKYVRALHGLGRVKWWFWMHMVFGLAGPWLILVHSTFRIGSLNAAVAMTSMVIVVASGIVGRFLYVRVHRGLDGRRNTLRDLRRRAGLEGEAARSRLAFAPEVESALLAFERQATRGDAPAPSAWQARAGLPWRAHQLRLACRRGLDQALLARPPGGARASDDRSRRRRHARRLVDRHVDAVLHVAQFGAYERLFALWHVAHLPFVVLLGVSAVVHVVAVHAY